MVGIDVSVHNGAIDWRRVREGGVEFAIIRAGYGRVTSQKDTRFEENYAGARAQSIPVGAYWYSYATTEEDARREAEAFLEVIKGKKFEYPVYYDVEEKRQFDLGKEQVSKIVRAFLEVVEAAGYWVGIYSSSSVLKTYISEDIRERYAVWVAHWGVNKPSYSGQYGIWQNSDKGRVEGIAGNVDTDICTINYPELVMKASKNGYSSEPITDVPTKQDTIDVKINVNGKTYSGTLSAE